MPIIVYFFMVAFTISSCKNKEEEYHNIMDKIESKSKNYKGTSISSDLLIENLHTIEIS